MASDAPHGRPPLDLALREALDERERAGLRRQLRPVQARDGTVVTLGGRRVVNVASNDYLGLSTHPALAEAAARAAWDWGAGSGASRLICGSHAPHHDLEESIAAWQQTPAALAFASGFAAASGTIPALVGPGDLVLLDRLSHACCIDAAKASGATWRPFHHNDPDHLQRLLQQADSSHPAARTTRRRRVLVVTEAVFSMDGDAAALEDLIEVKDRHGAWLLLDEAHATGLHGPRGAGLAEARGLGPRVEVHLGTLGKAVGASGGFIAGSRTLVDWLVNAARSFVFSTAPAPAAAAAATEGVRIIQSKEGEALRQQAWRNIRDLASRFPTPCPDPQGAILPWILGDEDRAMQAAQQLLDAGFLAPAIRYPTVPRRAARIRLTMSAAHSSPQVHQLAAALARVSSGPVTPTP
jgi:8-amino-7-oxononanoate synthase